MEATEATSEMEEVNPSHPHDAEFIFQPDEQMLVPEQVAVEKSGSLSLNQAAEVGVANDEDAPTTEQNVPNGETEVPEKNGEEAMAESGPEPEAEAESGPEAEGMSRDEVENAINEQELKYWSAVRENPNDFTSWTYLLQFVEQENRVESASEAFNAFLKRYPYCYGYWKKFADMGKKNGDMSQAREVFEKGIEAVALSVDLWVHYLNFTSHLTKGQLDNSYVMRSLFERAVSVAGEEFRSDKLWDAYIEWEKAQSQLQRVTALYDRILTVPTQNYTKHWEKFQEHINSNPLNEVLTAEELLKLKAEVGAAPPGFSFEIEPVVTTSQANEIEVTESTETEGEEMAEETTKQPEDPEVNAVREKVIAIRKVVHDANKTEVNKRWVFEDAIKRPYFHVKPLERIQLKNWREYLDFETGTGNHRRVVILFERCVIACALYEDFWQRFAFYMEVHDCVDGCRNVYERACNVHLPSKPHIHLAWAAFEEKHGNVEKAREILANFDSSVPGLAYVKLRRVNVERRCQQFENACVHYENAISGSTDADLISYFAIKYARFLTKIVKDVDKARDVLKTALEKDKENKRLYLQLLDLELSAIDLDEDKVDELFDMVKNSGLSEDVKEGFSQRRLEFLEDFSASIVKITKAHEAHSKLYKSKACVSGTIGRKRSQEDGLEMNAKVPKTDTTSDAAQSNTTAYDSTTDYSAAYPTTYNYTNPQWPGYATGHAAYNYQNWYQQYGQTYQPAQ